MTRSDLIRLRDAIAAGARIHEVEPTLRTNDPFSHDEICDLLEAMEGSVDAAIAFTEAVLPGCPIKLVDMRPESCGGHGWSASVDWPFTHSSDVHADTPATALILAALAALIERTPE